MCKCESCGEEVEFKNGGWAHVPGPGGSIPRHVAVVSFNVPGYQEQPKVGERWFVSYEYDQSVKKMYIHFLTDKVVGLHDNDVKNRGHKKIDYYKRSSIELVEKIT